MKGGSDASAEPAGVIQAVPATVSSRPTLHARPTSLTPETRHFLQHRVARLGAILGTISAIFLAFRTVGALLANEVVKEIGHTTFALHVAACVLLFGTWVLLRGERVRSGRAIYAADAISVVGSSLLYVAMGLYIPLAMRPDIMIVLILSYTLLGRSVYVPSTWQRTTLLGALIALGLLGMGLWARRRGDPSLAELIEELFEVSLDPRDVSLGVMVGVQAWWWTTVFLAASASQVIYGLRREVTKAKQLGQYELVRKLGEGGMGEVYEARHLLLRRRTAVKLLHPDLAGQQSIRRFEREVRATAKLTHPNTVTIFDFGRSADGIFYYAMELLEGGSLTDIVGLDGPQPPERVVHILHQVADALTEAHAIGLVHRDIKPGNVMLTRRGGVPDVAKVVDFGLVKEVGSADVSLTGDNSILGTPLYLAPEAIRAADGYDELSDLYALGAVAYYLLTADHVFLAENTMELLSMHLMEDPEPPSRRLGAPVPEGLEQIVLSLLAKDPAERPQSAAILMERLEDLEIFGTWSRTRGKRWWRDFGPELELAKAQAYPPSTPTMKVELADRRRDDSLEPQRQSSEIS